MTTTTFSPPDLIEDTIYNWDSATNWSPRVIPNSATAVVAVPLVTDLQSGQAIFYEVQILNGESYEASAATINGGDVVNSGTLTILNELVIGAHGDYATFNIGGSGTLVAGSLENDGDVTGLGQFTVTGDLVNRGQLEGGGLTISAGRFENIGSLACVYESTITVSVGSGGFANLSGGTLTGGLYDVGSGEAISIDVNGPITTLAASVYLDGALNGSAAGLLQTYAATGTTYVSLQSSLTTIAPSGLLDLSSGSLSLAQAVTDQGMIVVGGTLNAPSLTVLSTGILVGNGNATLSLSGTLIDNGSIVASLNAYSGLSATLLVGAPVSGSGSIVIGAGGSVPGAPEYIALPVTVELLAADSANVVFADKVGILQLDAPQSFTGSIEGFTQGDEIVLSGVSLQSVTAISYSGDATHGVLTLQEAGGASLTLAFQGSHSTSEFSLAAGTQTTSLSPASIVVTDSAVSSTAAVTAAAAINGYQAGTLSAGTIVTDSSADIASNLDMLQTLTAAGEIGQIVLADTGTAVDIPAIALTAVQVVTDSGALQDIAGAYTIDVTGATVAQAESIAGGSHIGSIAIVDSIANIAAQIDQLGVLASTGQVSSIAITDTTFAPISVTSTQFSNDHTAFEDMTGDFTVTVSASATSTTIEGLTGHSVTVMFSGTASDYSLTAQGDGIGLTVAGQGVTDSLRNVTALEFSDVTDIVAQTPVTGGAVTTGNIAELYGAVFGRVPDVAGLAFYQGVLATSPGTSLTTFAQYFLASPEYTGNSEHTYAESTAGDTQFITDCYENLLHRAPEAGAIPYYLTVIDSFTNGQTPGTAAYAAAQTLGHAYVLTYFSQSPEFLSDVQVTAANPSSAQHWLVLI